MFPVQALSRVFRAKFMSMLTSALKRQGKTIDQQILKKAFETDWCIYSKRPEKGVTQVLEYIGRYAYRVAISNSRIKDVSDDGMVTYDYKDYRQNGKHKLMRMHAVNSLGLFVQHILPLGFVRIRHYGILAPSNRDKLRNVQIQLRATPMPKVRQKKSYLQICVERGWNIGVCRCCGTQMRIIEVIKPRTPPSQLNVRNTNIIIIVVCQS